MARALLFIALCVLPALVSAARPARNTYQLVGRVYCDTCRCGYETPKTTSIADGMDSHRRLLGYKPPSKCKPQLPTLPKPPKGNGKPVPPKDEHPSFGKPHGSPSAGGPGGEGIYPPPLHN